MTIFCAMRFKILTPRILQEMNNRGTHVVVAGDSNQSIYDHDPQWQEATVTPSEIGRLINGDAFELGINSSPITVLLLNAVQRFLPRNEHIFCKKRYDKSDTQIRLCEATSEKRSSLRNRTGNESCECR